MQLFLNIPPVEGHARLNPGRRVGTPGDDLETARRGRSGFGQKGESEREREREKERERERERKREREREREKKREREIKLS